MNKELLVCNLFDTICATFIFILYDTITRYQNAQSIILVNIYLSVWKPPHVCQTYQRKRRIMEMREGCERNQTLKDRKTTVQRKLNTIYKFNRPGVAGAVLQTALSLIDSLIYEVILCGNIFKTS